MKKVCLSAALLASGFLIMPPAHAASRLCVSNESWTFSPAVGTSYVNGTTAVTQDYTSTCSSGGLPTTYHFVLSGHYYGTCTDGYIDGSINASVFADGRLAYATNLRPEVGLHFFDNSICGASSMPARGVTGPGD